jgi:hypothetical protein
MNLTDCVSVGIVIISLISLFVSKCIPSILRFLIASMDRCPSVGSGFSTGENSPDRDQAQDFPDLLQVRKLCLGSVSSCLCCCHGCRWKTFCRHSGRTGLGGTDFQFCGDNCRFHDDVVGLQLGLHRVFPPPCIKVCRVSWWLTSESNLQAISSRIFVYSYLGLNIPIVRNGSACFMAPLTACRSLSSV